MYRVVTGCTVLSMDVRVVSVCTALSMDGPCRHWMYSTVNETGL